MFTINEKLYSRDGKEYGFFTGSTKRCLMESCKGIRFAVRWSNGKLTWPCSCGIGSNEKGLIIL